MKDNDMEKKTGLPDETSETEETSGTDTGREYFERQYFEGDSLKEADDETAVDADTAEDSGYLKSFDEVKQPAATAKKKSGFKKQIILVASVFVAAALLIGVYFLILKPKTSGTTAPYASSMALSQVCHDIFVDVNKPAVIEFSATEEQLLANADTYYIYVAARSLEYYLDNVEVRTSTGSAFCSFTCEGRTESFEKEIFLIKFENGTAYALKCEQIFTDALVKATGRSDISTDVTFYIQALPGYDADGDRVSNGMPFMFESLTRADIDTLKITNTSGSYTLYRVHYEDGTTSSSLYFKGAEFCDFNQELLSSLVVDCTYVLTRGKITKTGDFADYGLTEEKATAIVELTTTKGQTHKFYIGDEVPSGGRYYARYEGKDFIYVLDSTYQTDVMQPMTAFLKASLGYAVSSTNGIYYISDVYLHYREGDTSIYVTQKHDVIPSSNVKSSDTEKTVAELIHDKTLYNSEKYSDWTKNSALVGLNTTDNKTATFQLQLTNYAVKTGEYKVSFGLVNDSANKAVLPSSVTVKVYDESLAEGAESSEDCYVTVASATAFEQDDGSFKRYTLSFKFEGKLRSVKLYFEFPTGGYLVFDEITVYADGKDAIPNESVSGMWKIVSPESFIQPGTNYAIPDTSAFSEILYGIVSLVGDEVVEANIYDGNSQEAATEKLKKYGLDDPATVTYYAYTDPETGATYQSYIYFSDLMTGETATDRFYYAYSNISVTESGGNKYSLSSNIVAKVKYENAYYLGWDASTMLDRSTFSMYIDKIDTIEMEFDGKIYKFDLQDTDNDSKLDTVIYDDGTKKTAVNTKDFRYVYVSLLECTRAGLYTPKEGDICDENKLFRFTMHSDVKDTELIFYQVSAYKVIYQTNGQDSDFYVLYSSIATVMDNVVKLINGESVK